MRATTAASIIFATFCVAMTAYAAAPKKQQKAAVPAAWAKEPDGVMGIKFGQPFLDAASLPDCPKSGSYPDFQAIKTMSTICFDGYGRSSYGDLWNTPDLGFRYTAHVMVADGKPVTFLLDAKPEEFSRVIDVLVERYGPPTTQSDGTVQNGVGATFDSQTLTWMGQRVTITAKMRSETVDKSQVFISDKTYWDSREARREKAAKDGASQL